MITDVVDEIGKGGERQWTNGIIVVLIAANEDTVIQERVQVVNKMLSHVGEVQNVASNDEEILRRIV